MSAPSSEPRFDTPTFDELDDILALKLGEIRFKSWGPRRRRRFGYFTPDDWYQAYVRRWVTPDTRWLDVGSGTSPFPDNAPLAQELSTRCQRLVGVDPSPNILTNPYLHDRACCSIEEFDTSETFNLATMRMVAEHITHPDRVMARLSRLIEPGGLLVIFTVYRWSPLTIVSSLTPHRWHVGLKRWFWRGEEKDTFPVAYRMNTRRQLRRWLEPAGFDEVLFQCFDDLATFAQFRLFNLLELWAWRLFRAVGLRYPEFCLLGVYRRREGEGKVQASGCTQGDR
jgi:SAM-dependent methyltransferase